MNPTMDQFNALVARVNLIDGQGLAAGQQGDVAQLQARITGLQTTLSNIALLFEQNIADVKTQIVTLQAAVNSLTGQS